MPSETLDQRVAASDSLEALREACAGAPDAAAPPDGLAVGRALYLHLLRRAGHPRFRQWLDVYLGGSPAAYRSHLQQPDFLYYPGLPPVPWFDPGKLSSMAPLRERIPGVRRELAALSDGRRMRPYVGQEAERDARWQNLAGREEWSAIHLLGGSDPASSLLAELPLTASFLEAAPLAPFPPHAPECFVSRLAPGVVLPEHFGLSNIKLTVHLPIDIPSEDCSITVGGVTRGWPRDDFIVFDDSFLHSAANRSARPRTVLIFDIVHPMLESLEVAELAYAIQALDIVRKALGSPA